MNTIEINCETGEQRLRKLTAAEVKTHKQTQADQAKLDQAQAEAEAARLAAIEILKREALDNPALSAIAQLLGVGSGGGKPAK